jgi:hypothetical protein
VAFAVAAAVALPGGEAAGQALCRPVSPATAPPIQCLVMTDPDAAGLAIWGVRGALNVRSRYAVKAD